MRLVAAKCPNCGAKIKLDLDKKIYHCQYCRYDIILEDEKGNKTTEIPYDELFAKSKSIGKILIIPIVIFAIIFITIMVIVVSNFFKMDDELLDNFTNQVSVQSFNVYIDETGVLYGSTIANLLDHVQKNMENYDKHITIVYNDEIVSGDDAIFDLIVEVDLDSFAEYTIRNDKDEDGYINKVIIEKVLEN